MFTDLQGVFQETNLSGFEVTDVVLKKNEFPKQWCPIILSGQTSDSSK